MIDDYRKIFSVRESKSEIFSKYNISNCQENGKYLDMCYCEIENYNPQSYYIYNTKIVSYIFSFRDIYNILLHNINKNPYSNVPLSCLHKQNMIQSAKRYMKSFCEIREIHNIYIDPFSTEKEIMDCLNNKQSNIEKELFEEIDRNINNF